MSTHCEEGAVTALQDRMMESSTKEKFPIVMRKTFPTMLGTIKEQDVTFCIDTSGSMYNCIGAVKEHLIEALFNLAHSEHECTFNILEFNTEVIQWSDKMVRCSPQTVAVAAEWIKSLQPKTGTNTLEALLSAFSDGGCSAVYLITDGMPDQEPTEILDNVVHAAQNRPVHCYYIQDGNPDESATKFLQDLAMDTYGSFHIITVTQHGAVERITPIYRAECTAEQVVRTNTGGIVTANNKFCSVGSTLNSAPTLINTPIVIPSLAEPIPYPLYPYYMYAWPHRYYYRHYTPVQSWSQYRPARNWLKESREMIDSGVDFVPGPGAMLIGLEVLARRNEDGLFYIGSVKSQIQNNRFLVEFGPCKHGNWKDTVYQETFVYDFVSYDDAMRHAILRDDKVLAPWEPEGERFAPGTVIEGQERRTAEGGGPNEDLVVAFHNGKTATVPRNTAVWIPLALCERITFEMNLPQKVRREFSEQTSYPEDSAPGYPTSGPVAIPEEYDMVQSQWLNRSDRHIMNHGQHYSPFYVPQYPVYYKYQGSPSVVKSEEVETVIPGTEYTKSELNEKVMSQLMKYKMVLEDKRVECDRETEKLLKRRTRQEPTGILKSTNKSVSFRNDDSDLEAEFDSGDLEQRDSGRGSTEVFSDGEYLSDSEGYRVRESGFESDSGLLPRRSRSRSRSAGRNRSRTRSRSRSKSCERPPWQYWRSDPTPELLESNHFGAYRIGAYDECVEPVSLEVREQLLGKYGVEWSSSLCKYVDPYAKYKPGVTVKDSMGYIPHPPPGKPEKQRPGEDISMTMCGSLSEADRKALSRREVRRSRALKREEDWQDRVTNEEKMTLVMRDQHRERIIDQINRERQRQTDEIDRVAAQREAKKQINEQLRGRIEMNITREQEKSEQRLEASRQSRQRRDDIAAQRRKEIEDTISKRQEMKKMQNDQRWQAHCARLAACDAGQAAQEAQRQSAKVHRIQQYRQKEERSQRMKDLLTHTTQHSQAIFRSQVLP